MVYIYDFSQRRFHQQDIAWDARQGRQHHIRLVFYDNKIIVKPSCVLCLSQKSVSGTSTFLWETPHVFPHGGIRLAPRFPFSYPTLYTATGASKPTNHVALDPCLIYCFVRRRNGDRPRNQPNQSRRWNSGQFGPFQILSRMAASASAPLSALHVADQNLPSQPFSGWIFWLS